MSKAKVFFTDAFKKLESLEDESVDALITDPPYFLDGLGRDWKEEDTDFSTSKKQVVTSLRGGMKFDTQQGKDFEKFMNEVALLALPKLKPGGWFVSFSAPRLYHRLAVGVEDAGYEIRDQFAWLYTQNQMKAMAVVKQLERDTSLHEKERLRLQSELLTWKTPQVKSNFEPILFAHKPREGTFYDNWKRYGAGLVNVKTNVSGKTTSNVISTEAIDEIVDRTFLVGKPNKREKGKTTHLSVKPIMLMRQLIEVTVREGGLVLDPFMGSGTTGLASLLSDRDFIGFENNKKYYNESFERFKEYWHPEWGDHVYSVSSKDTVGLF